MKWRLRVIFAVALGCLVTWTEVASLIRQTDPMVDRPRLAGIAPYRVGGARADLPEPPIADIPITVMTNPQTRSPTAQNDGSPDAEASVVHGYSIRLINNLLCRLV
jgi:hypothetical protein